MSDPVSIACPGACCTIFPFELGTKDSPAERKRILDLIVPVGEIAYSAGRGSATHYGCRVFDPATMRCREYDQRPNMCSRYPYGRACGWCTVGDPNQPLRLKPILEVMRWFGQDHCAESGIFHPDLLDAYLSVPESHEQRCATLSP
jgi:hypothetical protein